MLHAAALLLTEGDPWGEPTGGQKTFAKHLVSAFGRRIAVSSFCDDPRVPVGEWLVRPRGSEGVWFFNRGNLQHRADRKPLIPARVAAYWNARKFMAPIRERAPMNVMIDSPEMLFAAARFHWRSVCYRFAGVNNPVLVSRYVWARRFGGCLERHLVNTLKRIQPDAIIAAADSVAIDEFLRRTGCATDRLRLHQFPTRVDTDLFRPMDTVAVRKELHIAPNAQVVVAAGRLCWIKGWDLLLEALVHVKSRFPGAMLIFVGDGEDRAALLKRARVLKLSDNVRVTGFVRHDEVVRYMNAADVCAVGSHYEGWSLAMCEMLACGKPIVSTPVSGAKDMIVNGRNGFVLEERDAAMFAQAICDAMTLQGAQELSLQIAERYAVKNLARDLGSIWKPLSSDA